MPICRYSRLEIKPDVAIPIVRPESSAIRAGQRKAGKSEKSGTLEKFIDLPNTLDLKNHSVSIITVGVGITTQFRAAITSSALIELVADKNAAVIAPHSARRDTTKRGLIAPRLLIAADVPNRLESLAAK